MSVSKIQAVTRKQGKYMRKVPYDRKQRKMLQCGGKIKEEIFNFFACPFYNDVRKGL
jgi:hypothetical protein